MKNNLRDLRKRGRWSQAEIGQRLGMAHNSISGYESGKTPMDQQMVEKFAKALEVEVDAIEVFDETTVREQHGQYQADTIRVSMISDALLEALFKDFNKRVDELSGSERMLMTEAMHTITREQSRRADAATVIVHQKGKPPDPSSVLSARQRAIGGAYVKQAIGVEPGESGSSAPHSATGEPPAHKAAPPHPSAPETKPPHPAHGAKGRK